MAKKTRKTTHKQIETQITDTIIWYAKSKPQVKYRSLYRGKERGDPGTVNSTG
jgi:hypothetical protein